VINMKDDRAAFQENRTKKALEMGLDKEVFRESIDLALSLNKYEYSYLWNWMGVPIIQLPADVMATQEVIWETKPDVIIESGVARGGSVLFMASILEVLGNGKIVGVDIDIRPHNRDSIESHPMSKRIKLIEGGATETETLAKVRREIPDGARVMVVLDSDHSYQHVLEECRAYGPMVTKGCFLVVADTLLGHLDQDEAPKARSQFLSSGNEPLAAVNEYLKETTNFVVDPEVNGKLIMSSSPGGYLRCVGD